MPAARGGAITSDETANRTLRGSRNGASLEKQRQDARRRLRWAFLLALGMLGVEIAGGLLFNSLALLADAGHVLGDALAVGLALGAIWLAGRPGGQQRTFGWARAEIIAAMLNGGALLVIAAVIVWRAVLRLGDDPDVAGVGLLALGLTGLTVNGIAAWLLHAPQARSLNVRAAYYHVLGDALGSVGAVTAGIVIVATGWSTIDALASFAIAGLIAWNALRLLHEAIDVLLETAPPDLDVEVIALRLRELPGVLGVHDLHLWTVTSGFPALSCHLEVDEIANIESVLVSAAYRLQDEFGLQHVTLQPETGALHEAMACCDFPDLAALGAFSVGHRSD